MDLVGKRIKIVSKNPTYAFRDRYAKSMYIPEYNTYIGRYLPRPSWLSKDEFMLTTGDIDSPVRIIDKRNVTEVKIDKSNRPDGVYLVDGEKRKYVVTSGPFGRFSCNCTAFGYRKWCSHINEVKKGLKHGS
jgi:hypothetical protein